MSILPFARHPSPRARPGCLRAIILACALLLAAPPLPSQAQDLEAQLTARQAEAKRVREKMLSLSSQERKLYKDLAKLEERIARQEKQLGKAKGAYSDASRKRKQLEEKKKTLDAKRAHTRQEMLQLTRALWPAHLRRQDETFSGVESWPEADRRFTWLAALQSRLEKVRAEYEAQGKELETALAQLNTAREDESDRLETAQAQAGTLLAQRLQLLKQLRKVREKGAQAKRGLAQVLSDVAALDEELASMRARVVPKSRSIALAQSKGNLPWPARGKIVQRYTPKDKGLGLSLPTGAVVCAVADGQVVHADTLRGFGHVVIVRHPRQYYTLYAYLESCQVDVGSKVKGAQALGTAGYYPKADGPGLYFELSSGKNAINPMDWLAK